jgi:hypothetical protein
MFLASTLRHRQFGPWKLCWLQAAKRIHPSDQPTGVCEMDSPKVAVLEEARMGTKFKGTTRLVTIPQQRADKAHCSTIADRGRGRASQSGDVATTSARRSGETLLLHYLPITPKVSRSENERAVLGRKP